jgi:SAM-dependent methyltransferase
VTDLEALGAEWDTLGGQDPLWAVLTNAGKEGGRWKVKELFATGADHIDEVLDRVAGLGLRLDRRQALDFGCGVGRLTQALAQRFEQAVGVDIAPSMVWRAERFNRYPHRCRYVLNTSADLACLDDSSFDFVCSYLTLQHIPPNFARRYLEEFARVLAPGGVMAFQCTSRPAVNLGDLPEGAYRARLTLDRAPDVVSAQSYFAVEVTVRNESWRTWPVLDQHAVKVGNHWRAAASQQIIRMDDGRTTLPVVLEPGDETRVVLMCTAPHEPGRYELEVDLVHEGVTWFSAQGMRTAHTVVEVTAEPGDEADVAGREESVRPLHKMEMYGLPVGDVVAVLDEAEVVVHMIRNDGLAGPGWRSYEYIVEKPR